jgi:hypothetical protein
VRGCDKSRPHEPGPATLKIVKSKLVQLDTLCHDTVVSAPPPIRKTVLTASPHGTPPVAPRAVPVAPADSLCTESKMGADQSIPDQKYRGASKRARDDNGEAVEEALDLMRVQSHDELSRKHVRHLHFKPTWARLADYVVKELSSTLITLQSDEELDDAVHVARELRNRLEERDASTKGRITKETREGVNLTSGAATVLHLLRRIRDGKVDASFENAGLASTLRARWRRIGAVPEYVSSLVRDAVGKVLTSSASEGVKNFYSRVLMHWVPEQSMPPQESRGERVSFDSDDEL